MAGINVPRWLSVFDINTFNRETLAPILHLDAEFKATQRVDWVTNTAAPGIDRYFCMVGSNRNDYQAALGLSRTFSGHGSDGLVKIANAAVNGLSKDGVKSPAAQAFAYRSHSGYFGIVNSEEAYQNLTRFLFGDVRVDIWVEITGVRLPPALEGKSVDALYQFEVLASTRGSPWYLTRRIAEEDSVACRTHKELTDPTKAERRRVYLSTIFMADWAKVDREDKSMAYSLTLGVRVPDYEVDGKLWLKDHYEGTYLYRDTVIVQIKPDANGKLTACYGWQTSSPSQADKSLDLERDPAGRMRGEVKLLDSNKPPDVDGKIVFDIQRWNS